MCAQLSSWYNNVTMYARLDYSLDVPIAEQLIKTVIMFETSWLLFVPNMGEKNMKPVMIHFQENVFGET